MELEERTKLELQATYQLGRLIRMAAMKEDPDDAMASTERVTGGAISAKLVHPEQSGMWYLFNGEGTCLFPEDGYGFESRERAWLYWMGLGCPDDAEIVMLLDPVMESERLFGHDVTSENVEDFLGLSRANLEVIEGGAVESPLPKKIGKLTLVS